MPENKISFIPKKNIDTPIYTKGQGVFVSISFLIFLISALLFGGVFFYRNSLKNDIAELNDSVSRIKDALEPSLIAELIGMSDKINASETLLGQHKTLLPIFDFLENNTVKTVSFKNFRYTFLKDNGAQISMDGLADSYTSLALQAEVFEKDKSIKSVNFSGLGLGEKGNINFVVNIAFK